MVKNIGDQSSEVGDLLRDWRRINVALTRARNKLIITGSLKMMRHIPILNKLADHIILNNWMIDLQPETFCNFELGV